MDISTFVTSAVSVVFLTVVLVKNPKYNRASIFILSKVLHFLIPNGHLISVYLTLLTVVDVRIFKAKYSVCLYVPQGTMFIRHCDKRLHY